jgi:hypothetical protein
MIEYVVEVEISSIEKEEREELIKQMKKQNWILKDYTEETFLFYKLTSDIKDILNEIEDLKYKYGSEFVDVKIYRKDIETIKKILEENHISLEDLLTAYGYEEDFINSNESIWTLSNDKKITVLIMVD